MTWKEFTYNLILDYCNKRMKRTFTLKEFISNNEKTIINFSQKNKHPFDKIRQQLQFLRDDKSISFTDNNGTYTLRKIDILEDELPNNTMPSLGNEKPIKKEYLIELYARDYGWKKEAKDIFGLYCMYPDCKNTFTKENGKSYIEVHHIIPLYQGGEDGIWNLSVICAHHHRMAHYADQKTREEIKEILLAENNLRLQKKHNKS